MDSLLSEFQKEYPWVSIREPKNLFYKKFGIRVSIRVPKTASLNLLTLQYKISDQYPKNSIKHRREGRNLNIFLLNTSDFKQLVDYLKTQKTHYNVEHKTIDNYIHEVRYNGSNIARGQVRSTKIKSLGYNYRLNINTKDCFSVQEKIRLLNKLKEDPTQYRIPISVLRWLENSQNRCWYHIYFYVRDPHIVTFLQLSCGTLIDEVVEVLG